nr:O-antigen ligase family protein [Anaerolineae bacterium]
MKAVHQIIPNALRSGWNTEQGVWEKAALAGAAVLVGGIIAGLPVQMSALLLGASLLGVLALINPLWGLATTLILGSLKPLMDRTVPALPLDLGQIMLAFTVAAWLIQCIRNGRQIRLQYTLVAIPVTGFTFAAALSGLNMTSLAYWLPEMLKWVEILILIALVTDLAQSQGWMKVAMAAIFAALTQALIGAWQFAGFSDAPEHFGILGGRFFRAYGTFEQPNPFGGLMGLVAAVAIGLTLGAVGKWARLLRESLRTRQAEPFKKLFRQALSRKLAPVLLAGTASIVLSAAVFMSWSRGAWLALACAGLAILFAWPRKAWIGLILVAATILLGLLSLELDLLPASISSRLTGFTASIQTFDVRGVDVTVANYAVLERLAHWQAAGEMIRQNFWLGVGLGNYEPVYHQYALINWPYALGHAHNIYLNIFAETGLVGVSAYATMWLIIIWLTWTATRRLEGWDRFLGIGLLGVWIHLSAHQVFDNLYVANIHLFIGVFLGLLNILRLRFRENEFSGRYSTTST